MSCIEVAGAALGRGKSVATRSWYTKTSVKVVSASSGDSQRRSGPVLDPVNRVRLLLAWREFSLSTSPPPPGFCVGVFLRSNETTTLLPQPQSLPMDDWNSRPPKAAPQWRMGWRVARLLL